MQIVHNLDAHYVELFIDCLSQVGLALSLNEVIWICQAVWVMNCKQISLVCTSRRFVNIVATKDTFLDLIGVH